MSLWKTRMTRLVGLVTELLRRFPRAIAVFGFVSGLASFLLVDRQANLAKLIAVTMLVSWLWLVLESTLRRCTARWFGFDLPPPLLRYATQMIHQESLFFVLPFFAITTTWNSGQALFTGLLGAAALASITDPLYYKGLAARRWVFMAFHSLTLFAVLLTALPIILHLSTPQAYVWSLGVAAVLSFPSLIGSLKLAGTGGALPFRLPFNPAAFPPNARVELRARVAESGVLTLRLPPQRITRAETQTLGALELEVAP